MQRKIEGRKEGEGRDGQREEEENKEVIAWGGANLISSTSIVSSWL